ncbi:DEAD/DEAH box helicase [Salinibacter ruber]|uniref:DEAD/DEAH box helicase n=1 Tax=Salinibacter ruber TaxID=146919 RepID=UPI00216A6CD5|nr:DEAD/DEAH box helicase [Salinibacter ruber]MCS4060632.1 DEAD/DEAH box helicase domain-containing protein [Salinibacter ruber]
MLPSVLTSQLQTGVEDFLRTTFPATTPHFHGMLGRFFERDGTVFKGPYVNVDLPFRYSGHGPDYFPKVPLGFPPYAHQAQAFERLSGEERQSTLVATGTGSGKTEAFLWPILDSVRRHKGEEGIKAILIYPMNALANDQAGRIAEAVHDIDALEGVRAGLYVGDEEENPAIRMGEDHVITSRQTLRLDPPDVLLTNYKMLDYLLTRPADAKLWRYNDPETLRYLVVDELHTFDGAQGTDLACLIRRLKDRLGAEEGGLCCIGTSATLGGAEDFGALRDYAESVFGEPFEEGAVIGEQRKEARSFLRDMSCKKIPGPSETDELRPDAYVSPETYIEAQVALWFGDDWLGGDWPRGDAAVDVSTEEGRVQLGDALRGHVFLRELLDVLGDSPRPADAAAEALVERDLLPEAGPEEYHRAALDSFLALLSWARSEAEVDGAGPAPFVQMRSQLWLRELRRMVASVDVDPELAYWDDLPEESSREPHLPVAHCLECGAMGWIGIHRQNENRFRPDLKEIYRRYFNDEPTFSFAFPVGPGEEIEAEGYRHQLCGHDLQFSDSSAGTCESCGQGDKLLEVFRPKNRKTTQDGRQVGSNDCPFCGTRGGLTILGSRAASLTSVLISQLYASSHNDDKKLLTFSDSVQDAAHRAGFFESRTYRFNLRGAIQKVVQEKGPAPLSDLQGQVAAHYREQMADEEFVSAFIAPDMEWFQEFEALQNQGQIPEGATLAQDVSRRLGWEVWSEYGFRARIGRTLEKTGSSVATPDPNRLRKATSDLLPRVQNLGNLRDVTEEEIRGFLAGLLQHLKNQGAVFHPELGTYVEHGGNDYILNKRPHLPNYGQSSRLPAFISERSTNRFDPIVTSSRQGNSWLEAWALKCFGERDAMLEGILGTLHKQTLSTLVEAGLLERRSTGKGHGVWGLRPDALLVSDEVVQVRCRQCGNNASVARPAAEAWEETPCLRYQCTGTHEPEETGRNYYRRLYSQGDLRRIVAREHTGLLGRQQREGLEASFQRDPEEKGKPWDPNLLSCTPTLELGVDVGQLSSVFLCSVPPSPSNFVQRIGRGGRRSGNAVDVTVANGRPHDLYFFEDPTEMIDGDIEPPGVFLGAVEVLLRQHVAYCFDRWIAGGVSDEAVPPRLSTVLRGLEDENVFPHTWLSFVGAHGEDLFSGFVDLFEDVLREERIEALRRALEKEGGIETRVLERLGEIKKRREDLHRRSRRLYREIRKLEDGPITSDTEEELKAMRREKTALQDIYQRIGETNTYNFFTDAGLLPNYAFPESGVTLRSVLYRSPKEGDQEVWDEEYVRPASQALGELAPGAAFYANGRRVTVDQIDLSGEEVLERWRLCDRCAHMERVVEDEDPKNSCPRCGSPTWSDQGQERTLVQHDEVRATTADRKSRIDDSSDGRDREFFETAFLASFETQEIETAYRIDDEDLPFGFEFIQEGTFREINFGRPREQPLMEVGGQEINGEAFLTCPACGRVGIEGDPIEHTRSCSAHQESSSAPDPESLFLYREVESEALRILLPETSFAGTPEKVESFKAAFELGLEEYFDGSVDHLQTAIQDSPGDQEIARRRFLLVYDAVPGGTGYLADLLRKKEILIDVLSEALEVVKNCSCTEEEGQDGCYQCLYAYRNHYDMPHTSRSVAQELLEDLVARREDLVEIDTVGDISVHGVLESELEARFIERLRNVDAGPSRLEKSPVGGKQGYEFEIAGHVYDIEPQVTVGPDDGVPRRCSVDFMIRPREPNVQPIAVFLDGLQYHRNRIGRDVAQRRALRASGTYAVWSLTWRDVSDEGASARNFLKPASSDYRKLLTAMGEEKSMHAKALIDQGSLEWLIALLETQDEALFERVALAQGLLFARQQSVPSEWLSAAEARLPAPLASLLEEEVETGDVLLGLREGPTDRDPVTLWAAISEPAVQALSTDTDQARRRLTLALHLDDRQEQQGGDFEDHWNGFLRLYNLFQFIPGAYPATADKGAFRGYEDLIGTSASETLRDHVPEEGASGGHDEEEWEETFSDAEYSPEPVTEILRALHEAGVPAPSVPFELRQNGRIVGAAELGWPGSGVAVLLPDQTPHQEPFEESGWDVYSASAAKENPGRLIEALLEEA